MFYTPRAMAGGSAGGAPRKSRGRRHHGEQAPPGWPPPPGGPPSESWGCAAAGSHGAWWPGRVAVGSHTARWRGRDPTVGQEGRSSLHRLVRDRKWICDDELARWGRKWSQRWFVPTYILDRRLPDPLSTL